ncbi:hypothetical protein CIW48_31415 [Methylobacterium sp. P1-11]|uniref:hypothetical protein n=1 Tax=Methylobacterium sp. P1-11 TaxID=2024616 RepID=UPI0011EC2E77|nr:hypothetical protein [Methylobacterium sp. P1-11]KAA0109428.1 hypothetical protein CIW48_31415 [Methylobacterium sp. P1-11]
MPKDKHRASGSTTGDPKPFTPFSDDAGARTIGTLCFENGTNRIALHGSLDLTRDRIGLEQARLLRQTLDAIVKALEAADLPEVLAEAPDVQPESVRNPFA